MPSAVAQGQHYQQRTRQYLEHLGYHVAPLQLLGWIKTATGLRPIKKDAFASDLLAVSAEKILFVQVKGGESWRSQRAAAREAFARYPLSPCAEQWIVGWLPQAREPEIEVVAVGPQPAPHPVIVPARKKAKRTSLPLFSRTA